MRQLSAAWRSMSQQEKDQYRNTAARQAAASKTGSNKTATTANTQDARQRSRGRQRRQSSVGLTSTFGGAISAAYAVTQSVCLPACLSVTLVSRA